jgi:hypothetical protein
MLGSLPGPALIGALQFEPLGTEGHRGSGLAFLVLASFVVSFLAIRTSARMTRSVSWWPGGVETEGGLHLHHMVWGICLMLVTGFLSFLPEFATPWAQLIAIGFGIGAGFTMDEFALWIHLEDVYWSDQGRISFDAVVVAVAFASLILLGLTPFGVDDQGSWWSIAGVVALVLAFVLLCFAKGRILLGVFAVFLPFLGWWGAARLAKPSSPWARWRYSTAKLAAAEARWDPARRTGRLEQRAGDLIAGKPSDAKPSED